MLTAIKHGLANLLNFDGRDARQAFWFYVLFIYLVTMAIGLVGSVPMTSQVVMSSVEQGMAHADDPAAGQAAIRAATLASFDRFLPTMFWTGLASALILLLALAAAFVRRLHDSGLSGLWALLPAGIQVYNLASLSSQLERGRAMMAAQFADPGVPLGVLQAMDARALIGWAGLIVVIALGVRKSTPGGNRYGEEPFTA